MPITFQCPQCGKRFRVKDELTGRKARCKCGREIAIPSPATEPQPKPQKPKPQAKPQRKPRPKPQSPPEELELEVLPEPEPEPASSGLAGLMEEELVAGESLGPGAPPLPVQPAQPYPPRPGPGVMLPQRQAWEAPQPTTYRRPLSRAAINNFGMAAGIVAIAYGACGALYWGYRTYELFSLAGFEAFKHFVGFFLIVYLVGQTGTCIGLLFAGIAIVQRNQDCRQLSAFAAGAAIGVCFLPILFVVFVSLHSGGGTFLGPSASLRGAGRVFGMAILQSLVPGAIMGWALSPLGRRYGD